MKEIGNKKIYTVLCALAFTLTILTVGYLSFGLWTTIIFASGFLGGFIIWLFVRSTPPFADFKKPYWLTFIFFILLHRVEEYIMKFQEELSGITGNPVPDIKSPALIILVLASVGAWLFAPVRSKGIMPLDITWPGPSLQQWALPNLPILFFHCYVVEGMNISQAWQVSLY